MSEEPAKLDPAQLPLANAILEWKRKHNIRDGDPMMASLEVLEIYFNYRYGNGPIKPPPSYTEFRQTLEDTERLIIQLGKHAGEVIQEVRAVPTLRQETARGTVIAIITAAVSALIAGVLIGKFLL